MEPPSQRTMIVSGRFESDLHWHLKGGECLDKSVDIFPDIANREACAALSPEHRDQNFVAMLCDINRHQNR